MAARKPSITRTRRTKKTPEPEATAQQDTGDDISTLDIIEVHLRNTTTHFGNIATVLNARLEEIVNHLGSIADNAVAPGPDNTVLDGFVAKLATLEAHVGAMRTNTIEPLLEKVERLEKAVNAPATPGEVAEIVEPAKRRGRPPKAPEAAPAAPAAPVEPAKPAPKTEAVICKHIGTLENLQRPGLARCTACGAVVDVPVEFKGGAAVPVAAQQTIAVPTTVTQVATKVEETKVPVPVPTPTTNGTSNIPTFDDVRAVAITFAGKHGKPALSDALKEFGATNLSTLPEENRAGLMAKLQAGI